MTKVSGLELRKTTPKDLDSFFIFQLDHDANYLAAFTSKDPTDRKVYLEKYSKFLNEPTINMMTILEDHIIVGSISKFEIDGEAEITYWIDKKVWGKGIAQMALEKFLSLETKRPIRGRTAFDNIASQRVLEKSGFVKIGTDRGFANARQEEIEEFIYRLD